MKVAILVFLTLSLLAAAASAATVTSKGTFQLQFLPKDMTPVPYTYFFGTLALFFSTVTLTLTGRGWERDELPQPFVDKVKLGAMAALLVASLPAMIFLSVLIQEIRKPKKPTVPERYRPAAYERAISEPRS